jgi:DNA-directed RNA polymerase II subunit RPB1
MNTNNTISKSNVSKIIAIQFSILSPEEIVNGSVVEIVSRDTYNGNLPAIGGIFDPRMGVLEGNILCPTDGLNNIQTPGYFGHINLARPVFYIQFLNTIQKILKCVCFKCSKLLISKEKHSFVMSMANEQRWKYVFNLSSKIRRCGEDIINGCGCLQPYKIRKEGLATIYADWKTVANAEDGDKSGQDISIKITPEMTIKIFKRISDEDINFMGFSSIWSRPEWMVCQVLAVPPPAVRPSVKHDAQQRSEDDLSYILINIIKTNKTLQEKIQNNSPENIIDDWTIILQYYIASQIDNKMPGAMPVQQRSGRPLKSLKDRLNGKSGRMRSNLMAKRVDFSARSVITADPNISIRELGIPMKIAKNITKPVVVNERNIRFLYQLVANGPDVYPGAKILERKTGENITLKYDDRKSIVLNHGDIIHRHIMDGDMVIFNRQPTLHRMSMMGHIARVMKQGDTFRMNVADTKPYNADFDGDEMNLHMPQDLESESELKMLAAVSQQIISPANNAPIIGIYQDSMVGSYLFTGKDIVFDKLTAMNLLMGCSRVNAQDIYKLSKVVSNFDILSQIMPEFTTRIKNKQFKDSENSYDSNNIIQIDNGKYIRGQLDKGALGSSTKGLIHRVCNDFGNTQCSYFIDNLQSIITDYMCLSGFSVGISDLYSNSQTKEKIVTKIAEKKREVTDIIQQTQLGIFENTSGKPNNEEFETKVNNILNKASSEAGNIGLENLNKSNRFVIMVNAGSKGSELNIAQMICCLGQQNVDGKRIPYGFEHRTLPHYTKYDDSPNARGFVESSYISGLSPQELFFHAMGGRVGLIDTAVKTSTTGYIQRRLIKSMEDLMVRYDGTVRTSKDYVVQFSYGDDGIDTIKVENQELRLMDMSIQDIYNHFNFPEVDINLLLKDILIPVALKRLSSQHEDTLRYHKEYTAKMVEWRNLVAIHVFKNKNESIVRVPVSFVHIIKNTMGQQNLNSKSVVDITPLEAYQLIEHYYNMLEKGYYFKPTLLFKIIYFYYLSPKDLLFNKRFDKVSLIVLLEKIQYQYKKSMVAPGEMVGMIAAQSIGEPTTQLTLNTFHFAGVSSKSNVTRGVQRIEELLSVTSNPKNPSLTIYLNRDIEQDEEKVMEVKTMLEYTILKDIVEKVEIRFDPNDNNTRIKEDEELVEKYQLFESMMDDCSSEKIQTNKKADKSKWIIRLKMNASEMVDRNITMDDVDFTLKCIYDTSISCIYSDYNSDNLIFRIRLQNIATSKKGNANKSQPLDQTDHIYIIKNFQENMMENVVLRGVKNIHRVTMRKLKDNMDEIGGSYKKNDIWVLDTIGTNLLDVLGKEYVDSSRTFSNDIVEIHNILGMEATRQIIYNEMSEVLEFDGSYINYHHMSLLVDRMTFSHKIVSVFRHGINNDDIGPIAKASFEETPEMFLKAARHGELDLMKGVSANVMVGQEGYYGTSAFQVFLDMGEMAKLRTQTSEVHIAATANEQINQLIEETTSSTAPCSTENIAIYNNSHLIKPNPSQEFNFSYSIF